MVDALADYFGLDVTDLRRDVPDPAALAMIPEDVAREYLAIPVRLEDRTLHVAVAQPSDDLRFLLSETSGCSVRLRLAPMSDIRWAIDRTYQAIGQPGPVRPGLRGRRDDPQEEQREVRLSHSGRRERPRRPGGRPDPHPGGA